MKTAPTKYHVNGKVSSSEGKAINGASITIWWKRIRESIPVGNGKTREDGFYDIGFELPEGGEGRRLVTVEARAEELDAPLISAPVAATGELTIDLQVPEKDSSEFSRLLRNINKLLDRIKFQDIIENAEHHDVSFLSSELRVTTEQIMQVVVAERLEARNNIPAAVFYAFIYQKIPSALPGPLFDASQDFTLIVPLLQTIASMIFSLTADLQKRTITAAIAKNIIGTKFTEEISSLVDQLQSHHSSDLLNQPFTVGKSSLSELLTAAAIAIPAQEAFSRALAANTQSMRYFWRNLGNGNQGLTAEDAAAIEKVLTLGSFVKNYVPMIKLLLKKTVAVPGVSNAQGARSPAVNLATLATLGLVDWEKLVQQSGTPPGIEGSPTQTPLQIYAGLIHERITRLYPTAALGARIGTLAFVEPTVRQPLQVFLQNNLTLELTRNHIPTYLSAQGKNAFQGVAAKDQPGVLRHLRIIQRVLRVAPDPDTSSTLLQMGFKSASGITALGEQQFFHKAIASGIGKKEANVVYKTAAQRNAAVVALYVKLNRDSIGLLPQSLGGVEELDTITAPAIQKDPTLTTLFGSQDYCQTDHCTSVLSPAAYLCDILLWLENRHQNSGTVLDVFDSRRPDIRHLLLNCPNTETELPYIDLVIELLADLVSPPIDQVSTRFTQKGLIDGTTYYYIVTAVNAVGESAPTAVTATTPNAPAAIPAVPAGVAAVAGDTQVSLTWNPVPDAATYTVYWALATGVTTGTGTKIPNAVSPFVPDALVNGTAYFYIVTAANVLGESPASAEVTATPVAAAAVPAAPAAVSATPGDTQNTITWSAVPGAVSYTIYWGTTPGVTTVTGTKINGATSPFLQTAIVNGSTYYYIITASNSAGESVPSAEFSASPGVPVVAPGAPAAITASAGDGQVALTWDPVAGATSYTVYWSTNPALTVKNGTAITGSRNPKWKQTSAGLTTRQLNAAPEYFNQGAFAALFQSNYPFILPYSAGLDALRTYMNQWKIPLWQLRKALLPLAGGSPAQLAAVASEYFCLSPHASDIIINADFIKAPEAWNTSTPVTDLMPVTAFLTASSLTYESLLELLQSVWVQAGLGIGIQGINDLCMTSTQSLAPFSATTTLAAPVSAGDLSITVAGDTGFPAPNFYISIGTEVLLVTAVAGGGNTTWTVTRSQFGTPPAVAPAGTAVAPPPLDPGFLDRANRFLRLWLATKYKMWELDMLLLAPAVGNNILNQASLINLFDFKSLQDQTGFSVLQLLAFYQPIDTSAHRDPDGTLTSPFYSQIFLNPTLVSVTPDPDLQVLPFGGVITSPKLSDHLPAIQAALGISGSDAALLFSLTDNTLTLANLSLIYRASLLAKATKLGTTNLFNIAGLLSPGIGSLSAAVAAAFTTLSATTTFLTQVKAFQQSALSPDAISYILTPPAATAVAVALNPADSNIVVASSAAFPIGNFYITVGAEIILVTGPGALANSWAVTRAQQGTAAAAAAVGVGVSLQNGWATTTQMVATDISQTLTTVQQAVRSLFTTLATPITSAAQAVIVVTSNTNYPLPNFYISIGSEILLVTAISGTGNCTWAVSRGQLGTVAAGAVVAGSSVSPVAATTSLPAKITATQTNISVSNANGFPPPGFFISVGSEVMQVTAMAGAGNTSWTVVRGQQNTIASASDAETTVTTTGGNLNGSIISAMAANAHTVRTSGIANDASAVILNTLVLPGTGLSLLRLLADPAFTGSTNPVTPANFPNQFLAVQLFDKVAVLARALRLIAKDLRWLFANAITYGGADFTAFPVLAAQPALGLSPLLTTLQLIQQVRLFNMAPSQSSVLTLYDLIDGVSTLSLPSANSAQAALATISGWSLSDIISFTAPLGLVYPLSYKQPATYNALYFLGKMISRSGTTGAQLVNWGTVPPDEPTAENMAAGALAVIKSSQPGDDAWLTLAPKLMNPMRERRSAALQARLTAYKDSSGNLLYADSNALSDTLCIDAQMSSCEPTSRLVQAYIAVQIFVERCLMNLEAPMVIVDENLDNAWSQWQWMNRYRVWEANREVFLWPENWLIESQRGNRTEIYRKFEQEVHQDEATADNLEIVVLNYLDRLDNVSNLLVTGTCHDSATGTIYVIARSVTDPPSYFMRTYTMSAWSGWIQIPLSIKGHQAIPVLYRNRLCLFWIEVNIANEPTQPLTAPEASSTPPDQGTDRYVFISTFFSVFRNGSWAPPQSSNGKLFDKPFFGTSVRYGSSTASDPASVEALYSMKAQQKAASGNLGSFMHIDIFRSGIFQVSADSNNVQSITVADYTAAVHLGRAVFDGRFTGLELQDLPCPSTPLISGAYNFVNLFFYAQETYGPDAQNLKKMNDTESNIRSETPLVPQEGALMSYKSSELEFPLQFTSVSALEISMGPLLNTAVTPARVVAPVTDVIFDPTSDFFYLDSFRSYFVENQKSYWTGSLFTPVAPPSPNLASYEVTYIFHPFYHPFVRLFWHQLSAGGFELLYNPNLQQNPDQIDTSGTDVFIFNNYYKPTGIVSWDHDDTTGQDRQFLDFRRSAPFSVYHWELFYHIPLYIAQLLSRNQQFEDAQKWFRYIFDPTRQGSDPVPQRFWITKPFRNLSVSQVLGQEINAILLGVSQRTQSDLDQVNNWRNDPFDPFLLADMRLGVPYMKYCVMSSIDNIFSWADNLFASQSREAVEEATLLYINVQEMLGPQPIAVPPPKHADESFDQLYPSLDAFANAMVEIENVIGNAPVFGSPSTGPEGGSLPLLQTFYFKIPPNQQLLDYWNKVNDRLYKLRHCQTASGAPLQLALFDAPIDPGLLIKARAAGLDISSVLSNMFAPLPNYRFTSLYTTAADFVSAVRAYGASLQAALEKADAGALALLQQTTAQQLLADGNQIQDWQIEQARTQITNFTQTKNLAQAKYEFYSTQEFMNEGENSANDISITTNVLTYAAAAIEYIGAITNLIPNFVVGASGFGASPVATAGVGGRDLAASATQVAAGNKSFATALDNTAKLLATNGSFHRRQDTWKQTAKESKITIDQVSAQLDGANIMLVIAQKNKDLHQEQIDNIQKQLDFLNNKFSNNDLYDWLVSVLSQTYFQSYQLAYQLCKQVEKCYQFELSIPDTSFIQFGYWDSLYKGLLSGENLNQDLRRMQNSYLQQNIRRKENSRFFSLAVLDHVQFQNLLVTGSCDFSILESLLDNDYPGHFNRRITRVSVTVVYPNPGKFDNIKATLTMVSNRVRISADVSGGYPENPVGTDSRFIYDYAPVPQSISLGNGQDDPGTFLTTLSNNLADPRYLPFENAGVISDWHFDMNQANNEVDLSTVGDVFIHIYYTSLDGGAELQTAVEAVNAANQPSSGVKVFSALNDFASAWQSFIATPAGVSNQLLTLNISALKFPVWTRGKTINVTSIDIVAVGWPPGSFVLVPQAPLPVAQVVMAPVAGVTEPNVCMGTVKVPNPTTLGSWGFEIQQQGAADFRSLNQNVVGDIFLFISFQAI